MMVKDERERILLGLALILLSEEMEQDGVKRAGFRFVLEGALKKHEIPQREVERYLLENREDLLAQWKKNMRR